MKELADALHAKRPRDLRRRHISRLEAVAVVECSGDSVRLRPKWIEALDRERMRSGEKLAENLDRQQHERERERYRQWLAEKQREETSE